MRMQAAYQYKARSFRPINTSMRYHEASPDYFRALGIEVRRGRAFDGHDKVDSPKVMVI